VQDIQSSRQEMRGLLQRLAALPKENVEIQRKYSDDPASMNMISGLINQENTLLVQQASELAKKLPRNLVSGSEYYSIAVALQAAYDLPQAEEFLEYSIKSSQSSKDFNVNIGALRTAANLQFLKGQPEAGRVEYQRALNIFSEYPGYDSFTIMMTNLITELAWAYSEASVGAYALANQHVQNGWATVRAMPTSPGSEMLKAMVSQAEDRIHLAAGKPKSFSPPLPQLGIAPLTQPRR
jgi:tetratricopeptide (TPR) repeat protein